MLRRGEPDLNGGCLLWPGATCGPQGYGNVRVLNETLLVHRVAFAAVHGDLPEEIEVLHKYDVPACFADHHLRAGTQTDNMQDAVRKGRYRSTFRERDQRGAANYASKLTDESVKAIRDAAPTTTKAALARQYGVTRAVIRSVVNRRTWKHV